jgi:hypothetical protein
MSHLSSRFGRRVVRTSAVAGALSLSLLSSSHAWAAVQQGGVVYAPPQTRSFGGFRTEFVEYNAKSMGDSASGVTNVNVSSRALIVADADQSSRVIESYAVAYSTATWNKGANRVPSVQAFGYHTFFGQSFPSNIGVDKSTASTLTREMSEPKQLSHSVQFLSVPVVILGIPVTLSAGATGTVSAKSFARGSTAKGTLEKSSYYSDSGLSLSGSLELYGRGEVGVPKLAVGGIEAKFSLMTATESMNGSSVLEHTDHDSVKTGSGLEGSYAIGSGSGKVEAYYKFLESVLGSAASGRIKLASWPALAQYTNKWADYGIPIMSDAGDAW